MPKRVNVDQLLKDLPEAGRADGFSIVEFGYVGGDPLLALTRPCATPTSNTRRVYLSAGIHGDEPAGPYALLELLQERALPADHDYYICPLLNPLGLRAGVRENAEGIDLNRDYSSAKSEEIRAHRTWARTTLPRLDCALHLHEDWESTGFYLYELNLQHAPSLARHMLDAAERHLPVDTAELIDGYAATAGIISPPEIPEIPGGLPEALYFQERFGGLNYTLETPSAYPLEKRIAALKAAVNAAMR